MKQTNNQKEEYQGVLPKRQERLRAFEEAMGYHFQDEALLRLALTHCSFNGNVGQNNQRLEFLGDAVLEFVISEKLYKQSHTEEGQMTRMRANVVCEASLAEAAKRLSLGALLQLGKGEEGSGGREKPSILADTMESIMGAIYLDGGMEPARQFILQCLGHKTETAMEHGGGADYKTQLQHVCSVRFAEVPKYELVSQQGPAHERVFVVQAVVHGKECGSGRGKSKKEAEQNAAKAALDRLNNDKQ